MGGESSKIFNQFGKMLGVIFVCYVIFYSFTRVEPPFSASSSSSLTPTRQNRPSITLKLHRLYCFLDAKVRFQRISAKTPVFSSSSFAHLLPRDGSLGRRFRTCGVVSSSGTISGLGLGAEIDANEAVFRFNDAPTTGFEDDVGSKTTFRFVNSKVVAWDQFNFVTNPIYRQPGQTLLTWDAANNGLAADAIADWTPAKYHHWLAQPERPKFFINFKAFLSSSSSSSQAPAGFLSDPAWIWRIWEFVRLFAGEGEETSLYPPTSGVLGSVLAMEHCDRVTFYQYFPSPRPNVTTYCHYYDKTICDWLAHPRSLEQKAMRELHVGSDEEVEKRGILRLNNFVGICRRPLHSALRTADDV